jgi:hypothetical protein
MITRGVVVNSLKANVGKGEAPVVAMQHSFESLIQSNPESSTYDDKEEILNAIMFFAAETFGEVYGYREFDLIMGRAFPTTETLERIRAEEGKNLYDNP